MTLQYLEIINLTKKNLRNELVKTLNNQNTLFKQLTNLIFYKKNYRMTTKTLLNTFAYYNTKINYGDDLYNKIPELKTYDYGLEKKQALTKIRNMNATKILLYIFSQQQGLNKHKTYTYLRELFLKTTHTEFKWITRIICDKESVKKILIGQE
jgi:hypothetical protein